MNDIAEAIKILKSGGVILHKTDTVWGLACDAQNQEAIQKIKDIKGRAPGTGFIVLIAQINQLSTYVTKVPDVAWDIVEFAEDPLTVIYDKGKNVSLEALPQEQTIAVRLVKDDWCQKLVYQYGKAIVSTSANLSGEPTPKAFNEVNETIKNQVDYILQSNFETNAKPSKIIKLGENGDYKLIRG